MSRQDDVRELIQALKQEIGAKYRRLGELLKEVRDKEYWREWGFESFEAYCEQEIGYRDRKVRYLIDTVEGFERAGVSEEEAASIDQSKAAVIAPVLTPANKDEWVAKARTMQTRELAQAVAESQGRRIGEEPPRPWSVSLFDDQRTTVEEAMALALKVAGTEHRGVALVALAQEFLGTYSGHGMEPVEESRGDDGV